MIKGSMNPSRRDFLSLVGVAALGLTTVQTEEPPKVTADPLMHFLNRISYGVRAVDYERAQSLGIEAYLDEQLHPENLDDREVEALLARMPILEMDRKSIFRLQNGNNRAYWAMIRSMLLRAVYSERQLLERMTEFWTDHFNVPANFDWNPDLISYHRLMRQHALGSFRDLLFASARHPAMLYYLNNASSHKDHPNENYARELLELHTLGVDGGYSEADVKAVARAFTGWTDHPASEDGFYFDGERHDDDEKLILAYNLPAGRGIEDGLQVLSILAEHPATARFLCHKLCVRFVSDTPPTSLVDSLSEVWSATGGNIQAVLRSLFLSEAFQQSQGRKFRRPLDFFIGALRATGTQVHDQWALERLLQDLGQVPFGWQPPDGYPDIAAAWLSTSGLLARWNTAMFLTHGVSSDTDWQYGGALAEFITRLPAVETVRELVRAVSHDVFGRVLSDDALAVFIDYASDGAGGEEPVSRALLSRKTASLYGLMLASAQYQWR